MSEYLPLRITRSTSARDTSASVLLEQEPWDRYVGLLTRGGVVVYLRSLLFDEPPQEEKCAALDGVVGGIVYAYPDPPGLAYHLGISHGEAGERIVSELEYAEVLQIQNEQRPSLRYPTGEILSATWVTDAFAADGESLPRPAVSIAGGQIVIAAPVYGTLLVIYRVTRHTYRVRIAARPTAPENKYQSYVYAVWDGGNNFIEYQPPVDAEDDGRCNNSRRGDGDISAPDRCEPSVYPEDIWRYWDYCQNCALVYDGFEIINGVGTTKWRCE